jgi:FixJ family two-component response regulator
MIAAVDDDYRVRESLQSLLESAGYLPLLYSSAEEFLCSGRLAEINCLIADMRMPGMDGIELQRRVRMERPGLALFFISAHQDAADRELALKEGALDFLYKPFDSAGLLRAVEKALEEDADDIGTRGI